MTHVSIYNALKSGCTHDSKGLVGQQILLPFDFDVPGLNRCNERERIFHVLLRLSFCSNNLPNCIRIKLDSRRNPCSLRSELFHSHTPA